MIKLNVSKLTFEKYLISCGYFYKINQYEDFIGTIQRTIFSLLKKSDNLERDVYKIFDISPNMSFLFKKENILFISKKYLIELIKNGFLDLYFEEKEEKYSFKEMYFAQFFKKTYEIHIPSFEKNILEQFPNSLLTVVKAKKCLKNNKIELGEEELYDSNLFFYDKIFEYSFEHLNTDKSLFNDSFFYFSSFSLIFRDDIYISTASKKANHLLLQKMVENNFQFSEINYLTIEYPNNVDNIISKLLKTVNIEAILSAFTFILKNNNISFDTVFYSFKRNYIDKEEIRDEINILLNMDLSELKDIKLVLNNFKDGQLNEVSLSLNELNLALGENNE